MKGLVIGEDNLLYHNGALRGITETNRAGNWSTAESVKVFFTIGASFSGELRVLVVDNAESLDDKTARAISDWAETAEFLVILLKVASVPEELEEGIVYIREGEIITKPEPGHGG
jgi:predicted transcriptional regulator